MSTLTEEQKTQGRLIGKNYSVNSSIESYNERFPHIDEDAHTQGLSNRAGFK